MKNLFAIKRNIVKVKKFDGFNNQKLNNLLAIRGGENLPTDENSIDKGNINQLVINSSSGVVTFTGSENKVLSY